MGVITAVHASGAGSNISAVSIAAKDPPKLSKTELQRYYAFLWLEMKRVEGELGVDRLDVRSFQAGKPEAEALLASTSLPGRVRSTLTQSPEGD